jgi:polar amino acid transport system substrate-binding protein
MPGTTGLKAKTARSGKTLAVLVLVAMLTLSACAGVTGSKQQALTPTVNPPSISEAGVLKVGVDTTHAPFAGTSKGKIVGIDVDVASALAEELGLKISIVDMAGKSPDDLLADGSVDLIMDVEQGGASVTQGKQIGPYLLGGPALFTKTRSNELPQIDLKSLAGSKIFAQKDSLSAWTVDETIGKGTANAVTSLADAVKAVNDGTATYAAADAVVGSYLAIEYEDVACVKLLGTPIGVYCAVAASNEALADALTTALRTVRDNGELAVVLSKWLGPVSSQVVMSNQAMVAQNADGGSGGSGGTNGTSDTAGGSDTAAGAAAGNDGASDAAGDTGAEQEPIDTGEDLPDPSAAGST